MSPSPGTAQGDQSVSFDHLTVDDGLSYSTVHALYQDQLGLIWAGTRFGLNRYDGYDFKIYLPDPSVPNTIRNQAILSIDGDSKGNIWIGHLNGGISVLEQKSQRFLRFPFKQDTSINWDAISVRKVFEDNEGNFWIGTYEHGAIVFDSTYQLKSRFCSTCGPSERNLTNDFVFDFLQDPGGRIWIGHAGNGVHVYDPATDQLRGIHTDNADMNSFSKSLCLGRENNLWVGTEGSGLFEIDLIGLKVTTHYNGVGNDDGLTSPMITDLVSDGEGDLWIATDGGGCVKFSPQTGIWQQFRYRPGLQSSLNSDAVYDLMLDSDQNLWIGTFNGGINLHRSVSPPYVLDRRYAEERSIGLRSVLSIDQDQKGIVWLGSDGGGLFTLDVSEKPLRLRSADRLSAELSEIKVLTSLRSDEFGNLWIGTFARGLYLYRPGDGVVRHFYNAPNQPNTISHNNIWDIEDDEDGSVWLATLGAGVNHYLPGIDSFEYYTPSPGCANCISSTLIVDIALDRKRRKLWVASENSGLSLIDLSSYPYRITQFHPDAEDKDALHSDNLRCLFLDEDGTLWIGSESAGLASYDPLEEKFVTHAISQDLSSRMVNSIAKGPDGYLWVTTQSGIIRWKPGEEQVVRIGAEPFLINNQYNPRAALLLNDGRLILGATNGYSVVIPEKVSINTTSPNPIFTELTVSNQPVHIGEVDGRTILSAPLNDPNAEVFLNYQDKGFSISFTTSDYTQPDMNQFAYRLLNFDSTWNVVGPNARIATFSSLRGGTYELQVKTANSDGVWSAHPRSLTINVAPPFWKTSWFILIMIAIGMIILVALIAVLLIRQKNAYQQQVFETEQEILRLQNENLEKDMLSKQSQLNASVLQNAHKNQLLKGIKSQLAKVESNQHNRNREIQKIAHSIDLELSQQDYWEQFQLTFNQAHQDFIKRLQEIHPGMSKAETRLCCFMKMGLSNPEISTILNITVNGVEQGKYRLKKKIGLGKETSLNEYITEL